MVRHPMASTATALMMLAALVLSSCGWRPGGSSAPPAGVCPEADGPSPATVRNGITAVPVIAAGATWIESARGNTHNCRLYWVKLIPSGATAASPEQLVFFDHDTVLGTPTRTPKPYTTVLSSGADTVTVQYQWKVGDEPDCCPTGIGTTRYGIGPDGALTALDPIPNQ